jgi:hypothetical protein
MDKTFIKRIYVSDHYCSGYPNSALIVMNENLVNRIKKLCEAVKSLNAYCIEIFDITPIFYEDDLDEIDIQFKYIELVKKWNGTIDILTACVTDRMVYWKGLIKNTSINIETEPIHITEIVENI